MQQTLSRGRGILAILLLLVLTGWLSATPGFASPSSGRAIFAEQCLSCHTSRQPAPEQMTVDEVRNRKGPHLYYAGLKYNRDWLVAWLQNPQRIRPGGMFFADYIKVTDEGDLIDTARLPTHMRLSQPDAENVADFLMTLKAHTDLVTPGAYKPTQIAKKLGEMNFVKFKGCAACHEIAPGHGGLSGPEVNTAFARLQPDWMVSYIRNPQAWDPHIFMPNRHLNDQEIYKLIDYLRVLSEEQ